MRSLFLGEICAAADKFKFTLERSFEILFSRVLLGDVKFPANSAAKILNGKIPPSKILSNEALLRGILLGRNPLVALTKVASENSCAKRAVKFIKFTGSASSSETSWHRQLWRTARLKITSLPAAK